MAESLSCLIFVHNLGVVTALFHEAFGSIQPLITRFWNDSKTCQIIALFFTPNKRLKPASLLSIAFGNVP